MLVIVRHWLPIVTICPVNKLPDLIYISVEFNDDKLHELYAIRKKVKGLFRLKKMFMEDIAVDALSLFPDAKSVTVTLAFNRHIVKVSR